jgi:hypothetical protein
MTQEEKRLRGFAVFIIQWLDQTGQSNTFTREVTDLVLNYGYTVEDAKARAKEIEDWRKKVLGEN